MPPSTTSASKSATVYFGYGSNLWQHQMVQRCPTSQYLGIARLNNFQWIINERGYANVVEVNTTDVKPVAYEHEVWGLVYTLKPKDERNLDRNEGVPVAYTKEMLPCDYWPAGKHGANIGLTPEKTEMLVYINRNQTSADKPKHEYIYRMNMGIADALREGVPKPYVDKVLRNFIPEVANKGVEELARKQALDFVDER
ncbi:hypothetical protein LTR95_015864 [Oleoguttula sp. CCFEE 5521]